MKTVYERAGLVNRRVEKRQLDGRPTYAVISQSIFDTNTDDLWDALTNKQRLPLWFAPVEGDLRLEGRFQITGNAQGSIVRCVKPQGFDLTWEFAGDTSWVGVELFAEKQKTRLKLEHLTYAEGEHFNLYGPGAGGVGWDLAIAALGYYLDSNLKMDETKFMASPEWKEFVSFSANAWGEATIDAGFDRTTSLAAAKKTERFYLGQEGH